jgi:hypothetical protein
MRHCRKGLTKLALKILTPDEMQHVPFGELRFEVRTHIKHALAGVDWPAIIGSTAMRNIGEVRERYGGRAVLRGARVSVDDYVMRALIYLRVLNTPEYAVGFGTDKNQSPWVAHARVADTIMQLGVHMGFRWLHTIGKKATWSMASPMYAQLRESDSVWIGKPDLYVPGAIQSGVMLPQKRVISGYERTESARAVCKRGPPGGTAKKRAKIVADFDAAEAAREAAEKRAALNRLTLFGLGPDDLHAAPGTSGHISLRERFSADAIDKLSRRLAAAAPATEEDMLLADIVANLKISPMGPVFAVRSKGKLRHTSKDRGELQAKVFKYGKDWRIYFDCTDDQ